MLAPVQVAPGNAFWVSERGFWDSFVGHIFVLYDIFPVAASRMR